MTQSAGIPTTPEASATRERPVGLVVAVLASAGVVVSFMQSLVVPLVPELPNLLRASRADAAWVITVTLLAGAVATPVLGRLGDMYGKRRLLVIALATLALGSLVTAATSELPVVLVGRAVQGVAMGAIPLGISVMRDVLPSHRLGSAMGLMSASLGVGGAIGLPAAALVAQYADWHLLFYGAAALAVLSLALVLVVVPESSLRTSGRFDIAGAIGLSVGLVALLLGISKGADWGWGSSTTLGSFGVALVVLLGWGVWELRVAEPLVDLRVSARRQVLLTNLASVLTGFAMFVMMLVPMQLLQLPTATGYGLGLSMVTAGLLLVPMGGMLLVGAPIGARLTAARGPKASLLAGLVLLAVTYVVAIVLLDAAWQLAFVAALGGLSVGVAYAALPTLIIAAVPATETGSANGLNALMRAIGTSTASAVVGMVLAHLTNRFGTIAVPSLNGFRTAYALALTAAVVGIVIAAFIPAHRANPAPATASIPEPVPVPLAAEVAELAETPLVPAPRRDDGVRGQVLDSRRTPVGGAVLTVIDASGRQVSRTTSASDGRYAMTTPGRGSYTLICAANGHQPQASAVRVGAGGADLDLVLTGIGGLAGTLSGPRGGVSDAMVVATDGRGEVVGTTRSDGEGHYELVGLPSGGYTLAITADGFHARARTTRIDDDQASLDLQLTPTALIQGQVLGYDGRPCANVTVTLVDTAGNQVAVRTTGPDGDYRFVDLTGGEYTVVATGQVPVRGAVTLTAHEHHEVELGLTPTAPTPTVPTPVVATPAPEAAVAMPTV